MNSCKIVGDNLSHVPSNSKNCVMLTIYFIPEDFRYIDISSSLKERKEKNNVINDTEGV